MIKLKPVNYKNTMLKVKKLYHEAFPDFEHLSFWILRYKSKKKNSNFYVIYNENEFVCMTNLAYYKYIVYLYYLAINPSQQSLGYGSQVLQHLKETHPEKRILMNI